jgi:cytochrome c5
VNRSGFYRIVIPMSTATRNRLLGVVKKPLLLVQVAMLITLLSSHASGQNPSYEPDYKWHAPAKAAMRANPLARSPEISAGGKKIFLRECAECHQQNGSGLFEKHSADLRSSIVQFLSDGALFWKITNGNPPRGMPSFSRLPEKQRWQLVLFLRTLRVREGTAASK